MQFLRIVATVSLATGIVFSAVAKEGKGHGKSKHREEKYHSGELHQHKTHQPESGKFKISTQERAVYLNYLDACHAQPQKSLPPGLAKKVARGKQLPPGWQKKVVVGQVMPPDIFEVACPLPKELVVKLPPSPVGTITVAVQGKVVRILEKTKEILDILDLPTPGIARR